jgi:phosphoribosylformylglycinamidine synthase
LTDEAPIYDQPASEPVHVTEARNWQIDSVPELEPNEVAGALEKLLGHPTIGSKSWVWKQYDHMVMSGCTVEPGSDAGVVRLSIAGIDKYLAIANDCNNRFCFLDPYRGAQIAFVECMRNLACSGAKALAVTDNLNFGNPNKPEAYYMLKECVKGLADACAHFDVPVVGGNVSLYNEHGDGAIDPTPVVSMVGLIDKPELVTRSTISGAGQSVVLLGGFPDELGGSYFLQTQHGLKEGKVPIVDLEAEAKLQGLLIGGIELGLISSAHDLAEGGLLVAMLEMLFGDSNLGAEIKIDTLDSNARLDALLFGESQGRALIGISPENLSSLLDLASQSGVDAHVLGQTTENEVLSLKVDDEEILNADVSKLRKIWEDAIPSMMQLSQ